MGNVPFSQVCWMLCHKVLSTPLIKVWSFRIFRRRYTVREALRKQIFAVWFLFCITIIFDESLVRLHLLSTVRDAIILVVEFHTLQEPYTTLTGIEIIVINCLRSPLYLLSSALILKGCGMAILFARTSGYAVAFMPKDIPRSQVYCCATSRLTFSNAVFGSLITNQRFRSSWWPMRCDQLVSNWNRISLLPEELTRRLFLWF